MSLVDIKKTIESLNKTRQVEILKIFLKNNVSISENNNGTFINLSFLSEDCLNEVKEYLNYIKRVNNNDSLIHLNFLVPQFKKIILSKYFCLIRSKIVFKNKIWRFYIKFLGIYIFFFLLPIRQNLNKLYKSDSNYKS